MAKNIGTLITAAVRPNDSLDLIASAFANEIKGGYHSYATIAERNAIITARREWDMACTVYNDGLNSAVYKLKYNKVDTDINNNSNWDLFVTATTGNFIPLAGTATGVPVTGNIELNDTSYLSSSDTGVGFGKGSLYLGNSLGLSGSQGAGIYKESPSTGIAFVELNATNLGSASASTKINGFTSNTLQQLTLDASNVNVITPASILLQSDDINSFVSITASQYISLSSNRLDFDGTPNFIKKLLNIGSSGGTTSGFDVGINVIENSIATAFFKTTADRNGWDLKSPNKTGIISIKTPANSYTANLPNKAVSANETFAMLSDLTGSGNVNTGTAGRLALYPSAGTTVDDQYTQNANLIDVNIAAHATLAAARTYTIPDVGINSNLLMSDGLNNFKGKFVFGTSSYLLGNSYFESMDGATRFGFNSSTSRFGMYGLSNSFVSVADNDASIGHSNSVLLRYNSGGLLIKDYNGANTIDLTLNNTMFNINGSGSFNYRFATNNGLFTISNTVDVKAFEVDITSGTQNITIFKALPLRFNNTANTFYTEIKAGANAANYTITLPAAAPATDTYLKYNGTNYVWAVASGGGGITSLNTLTGTTQTFANDTNVTIVSSGTTHTLTWTGTLADARIASAGIWNAKQSALNGTGLVRMAGTTVSYDNATYLIANQTITLGTDLSGSGTTTLNATIVANAITTSKVADTAITYAKIQNVTTARLMGRATAGSGVMEEITLGSNLSFTGTTLNATGGGTPAGSIGEIQFNNGAGGFGSNIGLTYVSGSISSLIIGSGTGNHQLSLNYGTTGGGDITGSMAGVQQLSFGFNNTAQFGGTIGTSSGRIIYFYDRIAAKYIIGIGALQDIYIGESNVLFSNKFNPQGVGNVNHTVKAIASQTANLTQWQNSSGTVLTGVKASGNLYLATISTASSTVTQSSSNKIELQSSLWSGTSESKNTFEIHNRASTIVNDESHLAFSYNFNDLFKIKNDGKIWNLPNLISSGKFSITSSDAIIAIFDDTNCGFGYNIFNQSYTGNFNFAFGSAGGKFLTTGSRNTFVGSTYAWEITSGNDNLIVGSYTIQNNTVTGSGNIILNTGQVSLTSGNYNINLGNSCVTSTITVSNEFNIGGTNGGFTTPNIANQSISVINIGNGGKNDLYNGTNVLLRVTPTSVINNINGGNLTIGAGGSTGTGIGGSLFWQTSPSGTTGNAVNNLVTRVTIDEKGNFGFNGASFGTGVKVMFMANATTVPTTNPVGGGILYVEGGALKFRGSGGTVTTLGAA